MTETEQLFGRGSSRVHVVAAGLTDVLPTVGVEASGERPTHTDPGGNDT
jgi:hypothetical protein